MTKNWGAQKPESLGVSIRPSSLIEVYAYDYNLKTHSARNLGFIFDEQLPSLTKSLHFLNFAIASVNFAASAHLDFKTASTIATSIVHILSDLADMTIKEDSRNFDIRLLFKDMY